MRSTAATRPRSNDGIAPGWPPARLRPVGRDREVGVNLRYFDDRAVLFSREGEAPTEPVRNLGEMKRLGRSLALPNPVKMRE